MTNNEKTSIDWKAEIVQVMRNSIASKKISQLDEHRDYIMVMKSLGLSWDKVSMELNRILQLKGNNKVNPKTLSRIASKWNEADMIDGTKVAHMTKSITGQLSNPVEEQKEVKPTPVSPTAVDTYQTVQEFILDAVKLSNRQLHAKDLIEETFHAHKGKARKEMLEGLVTVLKNRTTR